MTTFKSNYNCIITIIFTIFKELPISKIFLCLCKRNKSQRRSYFHFDTILLVFITVLPQIPLMMRTLFVKVNDGEQKQNIMSTAYLIVVVNTVKMHAAGKR